MDHPVFGTLEPERQGRVCYPWWNGHVELPAFDDWHKLWWPGGKETAEKTDQPRSYELRIKFEADDPPDEPLPEQVQAFQFLQEHQQAIAPLVLQAIHDTFMQYFFESWQGDWELSYRDDPKLKDEFGPFEELMKSFQSLESQKEMVALNTVWLHPQSREDYAYVGLQFSLNDEHGLGVLTHKGRVVSVNAAEEAFDSYGIVDDLREWKRSQPPALKGRTKPKKAP